MGKKILAGLFAVLAVFVVTGCEININTNGGKKEVKEDNKVQETKKEEVKEVKIDDETITFDNSSSFDDMKYKYSSNSTTSSSDAYKFIEYKNNDELVYKIVMFKHEDKTLEEAIDDASNKLEKTINSRKWTVYEDVSQDGNKMVNYAYQNGDDTYVITFTSVNDISDFITAFMKNIDFK